MQNLDKKKLIPLKKIIKLKRNDKCWCGSGLKYKYCCYEKDNNLYNRSIYRMKYDLGENKNEEKE